MPLTKSKETILNSTKVADGDSSFNYSILEEETHPAMEVDVSYTDPDILKAKIKDARKAMEKAAKELEFIEAAKLRDYINNLEKQLTHGKN
jgi:excinuclease ABC subunit B